MAQIPFFASTRLSAEFEDMSFGERASFLEILSEETQSGDAGQWKNRAGESLPLWLAKAASCAADGKYRHGYYYPDRRRDLLQLAPTIEKFALGLSPSRAEREGFVRLVDSVWDCARSISSASGCTQADFVAVMTAYAPIFKGLVQSGAVAPEKKVARAAAALVTQDHAWLKELASLPKTPAPLGAFSKEQCLASLPFAVDVFLKAGGDFTAKIGDDTVAEALYRANVADPVFRQWLWTNDPATAEGLEQRLIMSELLSGPTFANSPKAQAKLGLARADWFNTRASDQIPLWVSYALEYDGGAGLAVKKKSQLAGDPDKVWQLILYRSARTPARLEAFEKAGLLATVVEKFRPAGGMLISAYDNNVNSPLWIEQARSRDMVLAQNSSAEFWLGSKNNQRAHAIRIITQLAGRSPKTADAIARLVVRLKLKDAPHPALAAALSAAFAISGRSIPQLLKDAASHSSLPPQKWRDLCTAHPKVAPALQLARLENAVSQPLVAPARNRM